MRITLHTRVRADRVDEYERAKLLDPPHDYPAAGDDDGLPVVWPL
jgi:hypothetical protein